jgi:hypothetical protein
LIYFYVVFLVPVLLGVHWPWICELISFITFWEISWPLSCQYFFVLICPLLLGLQILSCYIYCPTNLRWSSLCLSLGLCWLLSSNSLNLSFLFFQTVDEPIYFPFSRIFICLSKI